MATKFYLCTTCGNVVVKVEDSGIDVVCCGSEMSELKPQHQDAVKEKHLPVVDITEDGKVRVKIGSEAHPMIKEHHISFVYLETEHGGMIQYLSPGQPAEVFFGKGVDKPVAVYAYCNIHGLWEKDLRGVCEREKPEEQDGEGKCKSKRWCCKR